MAPHDDASDAVETLTRVFRWVDCDGGLVATDWSGNVIAHRRAGELGIRLDRAIREATPLTELCAELGLSVEPVVEDEGHEALSPLTARTLDGTPLHTVLELNPFSVGLWMVETVSGSRHVFDLDAGQYRRFPAATVPQLSTEEGWYVVEVVDRWPAVNSTFGVTGFSIDPEIPPDLVTETDVLELALTSSWVTRIVRVPEALWGDEPPELESIDEHVAVAQLAPRNAWILIGDEAAYPFASDADRLSWTAPKCAQRGDLAFIYYVAPRKQPCYAARVLTPAVYDPTVGVNAARPVDPHQWWVELGRPSELTPVPYAELRDLFNGHLVLRGRPTTYVPPDVVNALLPSCPDRLVVQGPVGHADLPQDPTKVSLAQWTTLPSGRFDREAEVERYVVEPLLEWLVRLTPGAWWTAKARLGSLVPDYTLTRDNRVVGIVEVKLGIRGSRDGRSWSGPDVTQVTSYCNRAGVPGALIDANRVVLFDAD